MADKSGPNKPGSEADKQARLAKALRANLRRRKDQARSRRDEVADGPGPASDSAVQTD